MPQPLGLGHMVRIRINVEAIKYNVLPGLSITPEWKGEEKGFDRKEAANAFYEHIGDAMIILSKLEAAI